MLTSQQYQKKFFGEKFKQMKWTLHVSRVLFCVFTAASAAFAGVTVSAPGNGATVATTIQYVATASSTCASGISAIGVYTTPGKLAFVTGGAKLNTLITLAPGAYNTVVQEWDNCGGFAKTPVKITVGGSGGSTTTPTPPAGAKVFGNLQTDKGWTGYALLPPMYPICPTCVPSGPQLTWSATRGVATPSLSGGSMAMAIGGKMVYSDGLWNNHLIGDFSSQGLPDKAKTLAPSLHKFTYDVYFYVKNVEISQALEFDINQFINGKSYIWGHECRIAGGHQWDTWNNAAQKWVPSGIACNPVSNSWNHLVIQVERTAANQLHFISITLNGKTSSVDRTDNPTPRPGWYGVTINYQQDGNKTQQPYTVWLDKLNFYYQ